MSEDLIKRSDAIKAICDECGNDYDNFSGEVSCGGKCWVSDLIRGLPSADRPQGEWIKHDDERDCCSRCKHIFKTRTITQQDKWTRYIDDLGYNYCPNCGSKMRGEHDD